MKLLLRPHLHPGHLCRVPACPPLASTSASPELRQNAGSLWRQGDPARRGLFRAAQRPRAGTTDQQKLELVNNCFNNLTYSEDPRLWGDEDYWANPLEFIGARGVIARITASPSTKHPDGARRRREETAAGYEGDPLATSFTW